jgi:hypothetical protein
MSIFPEARVGDVYVVRGTRSRLNRECFSPCPGSLGEHTSHLSGSSVRRTEIKEQEGLPFASVMGAHSHVYAQRVRRQQTLI